MTGALFSFRMLGGVADQQRLGPFNDEPGEIRVPYEVESIIELPNGYHAWKVDRYFPSFAGPGVFVFFRTVEPNREERARIRAQTGQVFR